MGQALDNFIQLLESELRTGGGVTLDEVYDLALALREDLAELEEGV
jgi:hypothetical protein